MARDTLPVALGLTFGDEGGYSNVKTGRGGPNTASRIRRWRRTAA